MLILEFGTALKVNGLTRIEGDLDIFSNGVLKFNGVPFQPTTVFTDDISGYVYYNGPKNIGIGTVVPTTELDVAGTINAEALQVNGVDLDDIYDSDFIRDRQILIDSALTTALIDSDYVRARADAITLTRSSCFNLPVNTTRSLFFIDSNTDTKLESDHIFSPTIKSLVLQSADSQNKSKASNNRPMFFLGLIDPTYMKY